MNSTSGASRILLIEDNPADAMLAREAILESGYAVHLEHVEDYDQARLKLLREQPWHLVISDMSPDVAVAEEFFRWVRSEDCQYCPPIVVYSGFYDPIRAYRAGANAFVGKVSDVEEVFAQMKSLLDFWLNTAIQPVQRN